MGFPSHLTKRPGVVAYGCCSLWTAKLTIAEFLRRLYSSMWKRSWEVTIHAIRWFLGLTFIAVVIATLTECRPFPHYWQVVPDPGPHCRQGFVQLITMGVSDTITDLVLVAFPVPVILASHMPITRKISLVLLFALSLSLVAITIYRVTATIDRHANQQFRSLVASFEILAAAAVANALVLASFVRDRGAKKAKYKYARDADGEWGPGSFGAASGGAASGAAGGRDGSVDRPPTAKARTARALSWGSDGDLVGDLGIRLGPEFREVRSPVAAMPVPAALPLAAPRRRSEVQPPQWPQRAPPSDTSSDDGEDDRPADAEAPPAANASGEADVLTPRRMSFFDVGGLLDTAPLARPRVGSAATVDALQGTSALSTPGRKPSGGALPGPAGGMSEILEGEPEETRLRPCKSAQQ